MTMLIAEIGNNHFGNLFRFKELIRAAHEAGADLIKSQAFKAEDIRSGSMPLSFYQRCEFSEDTYCELIDYARGIGTDLFFSIFSIGFSKLLTKQKYYKITGSQSLLGRFIRYEDNNNLFISVKSKKVLGIMHETFKEANFMYVSDYCSDVATMDPMLSTIDVFKKQINKNIGYSDHAIGISNCLKAIDEYRVSTIEKHFCMENHESFNGIVFRDTVHGVTSKEFEILALKMSLLPKLDKRG